VSRRRAPDAVPGWPDKAEAHGRIERALPFLEKAWNTSTSWGARTILADLYGWREPVTKDNWRKLDGIIRERADDRAWHREILKRAGIVKACTELARREKGEDDDFLAYASSGVLHPLPVGEFDTALYELERCWAGPPAPLRPSALPDAPRSRGPSAPRKTRATP